MVHSRRMMMTSGGGVHYKSMFDAGSQIVAKEGVRSLFKGAGANILRGVAGAGVLSLYDKLQEVLFGKVYSGGTYLYSPASRLSLTVNFRLWLSVFVVDILHIISSLVVLSFTSPATRHPIDLVVISAVLHLYGVGHTILVRIEWKSRDFVYHPQARVS